MSVAVNTAEEHGPITSDSRTFRRAWRDLSQGFGQHELWLQLGWQDIKQRYRRSTLGPFWITIATAVMAMAIGLLYSVLLQQNLRDFLPHVLVGFILWAFISGCIQDGAEVFIKNDGLITQLPSPLSIHVYRLVTRHAIFFAHNMIVYVLMLAVFRPSLNWTFFLVIPGLFLFLVNGIWVVMLAGIIATRFRDVAPLLESIVQLMFYMTPIVWTTAALTGEMSKRAKIAEVNPLYHYLDIVRAPLIGQPIHAYHWYIVIACTAAGWALTLLVMRKYRSRVAYWV